LKVEIIRSKVEGKNYSFHFKFLLLVGELFRLPRLPNFFVSSAAFGFWKKNGILVYNNSWIYTVVDI
jgi:hypothetical protein